MPTRRDPSKPDPLVAALIRMGPAGRAMWQARRAAAERKAESRAALKVRTTQRARTERRAGLADLRARAHAAGYRRVSRWGAAGRPVAPGVRTPYVARGAR